MWIDRTVIRGLLLASCQLLHLIYDKVVGFFASRRFDHASVHVGTGDQLSLFCIGCWAWLGRPCCFRQGLHAIPESVQIMLYNALTVPGTEEMSWIFGMNYETDRNHLDFKEYGRVPGEWSRNYEFVQHRSPWRTLGNILEHLSVGASCGSNKKLLSRDSLLIICW